MALWTHWILTLAYMSLGQRDKSGVKIGKNRFLPQGQHSFLGSRAVKTRLFNILYRGLPGKRIKQRANEYSCGPTADLPGRSWNPHASSQKFALDFISSFQMHVERAWKYWLDASVGRRVSWSVCYCWGEGGLAALRASQLPVGSEILLPTKQTEKLEGQNKYHSVFNPLPSLAAKQKNWPGNMMGAFVWCAAFPPPPLSDFQVTRWKKR